MDKKVLPACREGAACPARLTYMMEGIQVAKLLGLIKWNTIEDMHQQHLGSACNDVD